MGVVVYESLEYVDKVLVLVKKRVYLQCRAATIYKRVRTEYKIHSCVVFNISTRTPYCCNRVCVRLESAALILCSGK